MARAVARRVEVAVEVMGRNYLLVKVQNPLIIIGCLKLLSNVKVYSYSLENVTKLGPPFCFLFQATPCVSGNLKLRIFVAIVKYRGIIVTRLKSQNTSSPSKFL